MNGRLRGILRKAPWLENVLAAIGGVIYVWRTWDLAHRLTTMILDESMYIYKGYLFITGKYIAYQDYGPLTNHMPLAFIVPGFIQKIFGPRMEAARVFAFIVGLVMLVGFWFAAYRAGGKWWAALIVWVLVLTPTWQEVFSQGLTQGLVNALIAWSFVFLIGKERKTWQLALSAALLAFGVMTRINLLPIFGVVLIYIFWQHGWRKGLAAAVAGAVVGFGITAFFWPDILKFLTGWIPEGVLGFVEPFRSPWSQHHVPDGFSYFPIRIWPKDLNSYQWKGIRAFFEALNFNFVPFLIVAGTLAFWPKREAWPDLYRLRLSVFLVVGWLLMAVMHAWVALTGKTCPFFCLSGYFTFFNFLALMLLPAAWPFWRKRPPVWRMILGMTALFGIIAGALYPAGYRPQRVSARWYSFLQTPIPRISGGKILWEDRGPLLSLLESKLNLGYVFLVEQFSGILYWLILALLVFGVTALLYWLTKTHFKLAASWPRVAFVVFLGLGVILGPAPLFSPGSAVLACEDSVIESHEKVAEQLQAMIEPGSRLDWELTSNMLLLYLPGVMIFPPQLNTGFNFVHGSDPSESDEIYRFGYWDEYLEKTWLEQADYALVPGQKIDAWQTELASGRWQQVGVTDPYESCRPNETRVYVLAHGEADD